MSNMLEAPAPPVRNQGLGLILGPVAALLGFASRRRGGGNFAVAAIVLGLIAFVASGVWIAYAALSMGW